jgi:tRNA threonylcarbamoyl adenosine modification protein YeaZ
MRILAVDTALGACSVAITHDGATLAHQWTAMARGHAEALAPMVDHAMRQSQLGFADLDRLAVTTGPGTFTGQRVGLAFMRGLRLALDRSLVGVTTLETIAAAASAETGLEAVAVVHEAKRGEVYAALFRQGEAIVPVQVETFERMMGRLEGAAAGLPELAVAGTKADAAAAWLKARGAAVRPTAMSQPDALWVARLAEKALAPIATARPLYLRAPDAKFAVASIRTRPAGLQDGDLLASLNGRCLPQAWDAAFFVSTLAEAGGIGAIAEVSGMPAGFALARVVADEAEILAIGVVADFRQNGLGRRLFRDAAAQAARLGAATLFLEVAEDNLAARTLYERHGLYAVGRRKRYYGEGGQDALLLRGPLPLEIPRLGVDLDLA